MCVCVEYQCISEGLCWECWNVGGNHGNVGVCGCLMVV